MSRIIAFASLLVVCAAPVQAEDWPMFRGSRRSGISTETKAPEKWSNTENIKWKAPLPHPGNSSPIVSAGRVFVTCAEDKRGHGRSLYCFDAATGKPLWVRTVQYEAIEPTHSTNPHAASSPASDGQRVVVWHGSAGVHCYDHDGKELWKKDLGPFRHIWGYAASPVILDGRVILNCGPGNRSFIIALDLKTGDELWKLDVPGADDKNPQGKWMGSWSTPVPFTASGQQQLLIHLPDAVKALDPRTGRELWSVRGVGDLSYTDPVINENATLAAALSGFQGPAIGFRPEGKGDITDTSRLWRTTDRNQLPQRIGTGVIFNDILYVPGETVIQCLDLKTGKELWRHRPDGSTFWSPTAATADGKIYITSQKGTTYVIKANPAAFTLLSANALGEPTNSAPAISNGRLYLRTFQHLYCIGE